MKTIALFLAVCLLASGCDDSKKPLSDPKTSKADERLIGVWREQGDDGETFYRFSQAGTNFPKSMMRVAARTHSKGQKGTADEYLVFPTVLGGKTYLNVVLDGGKKVVKRLNETGWKAEAVTCYTFIRYQIDGGKLVMWVIDEDAKERAIKSGKIKGLIGRDSIATFTDTTENVAHFVAEAGDSLFNTKEPLHLERVASGKMP